MINSTKLCFAQLVTLWSPIEKKTSVDDMSSFQGDEGTNEQEKRSDYSDKSWI